ncbi:MAG: hypothetical protein Q4P29_00020 [Tissierellia bacterium]|nr:hypothetical protein [Tissierellia bacterium]
MANDLNKVLYKILKVEFIIALISSLLTLSEIINTEYLLKIQILVALITAIYTDIAELNIYNINLITILVLNLSLTKYQAFIDIKAVIFIFLIYLIIYFISRHAIGIGDIYLASILSLSFNLLDSFIFFSYTFIFAAAIAIVMMLFKKADRKTALPLIPFLTIAYYLTLYRFGGIYVF